MKIARLISLGVAAAIGTVVSAVEIKLPEDTERLIESPLPGYSLAVTYCYTCHSTDYVRIQPPSSRIYWRGAVVKMQKTFGAPIPDDAVDLMVEYLVRTYGTEKVATPAPSESEKTKSTAPPAKK